MVRRHVSTQRKMKSGALLFAVGLAVGLLAPGSARADDDLDRPPPPGIASQQGFPIATPFQEFSTRLALALTEARSMGVFISPDTKVVVSAYRSKDYDRSIQRISGEKPTKGPSPHEGWLAADISVLNIGKGKFEQWSKILDQFGLYLPFPWDPVHVEPKPTTALFDAKEANANNFSRDTYADQTTRLSELRQWLIDNQAPELEWLKNALPEKPTMSEDQARSTIAKFDDLVAAPLVSNAAMNKAFRRAYDHQPRQHSVKPGVDNRVPVALRPSDSARGNVSLLAVLSDTWGRRHPNASNEVESRAAIEDRSQMFGRKIADPTSDQLAARNGRIQTRDELDQASAHFGTGGTGVQGTVVGGSVKPFGCSALRCYEIEKKKEPDKDKDGGPSIPAPKTSPDQAPGRFIRYCDEDNCRMMRVQGDEPELPDFFELPKED